MNNLMLDSIELGKLFGISPTEVNHFLEQRGLQYLDNDRWKPTRLGGQFCDAYYQRAWGLLLKWKFSVIKSLYTDGVLQ